MGLDTGYALLDHRRRIARPGPSARTGQGNQRSKSILEIGGLDTSLQKHSRLLDHRQAYEK
jgi:hypothetical protein